MKKYLSIDNGLLMLCMSLFLFMMFICTQLLVSGYIENRTPEEIYVVNEKQITEHQLNQLSHILKECDANAYMTGIYMKDGDLFERKEVKLWLNHEKNYDLKSNFMFECIWRILTAGFAEQNGRNAKLNGRITFDY